MGQWSKAWRLFVTSPLLQALTIGLLATWLAGILVSAAPGTFTALDWFAYDSWLRHRTPTANASLTVIARDDASENRFGTGPWDRTILAQLISAAHEAGARAIGVDDQIARPSPSQQGGVASDALLIEAVRAAAPVMFVHQAESVWQSEAMRFGHVTVSPDADQVVRRVPATRIEDGRTVPAFGRLLYELSRDTAGTGPSPDDPRSMLLNPAGKGSLLSLSPVPLSSVWDAVQHQDEAALRQWFKDKVVVLLPQPAGLKPWLLPTGESVTGMTAQLHLLNTLLNADQTWPAGPVARIVLAFLVASFVAWCLIAYRGAIGLVWTGIALVLYALVVAILLPAAHVVLPLASPLTASLVVLGGTAVWTHLSTGPRMRLLEREMLAIQQDAAAVRDALIVRQNRAETLEEDLEEAQAAVAQSSEQRDALARAAASLQSQLFEVQTQEQSARRRLEELERRLQDLQAAGPPSPVLGQAELDHLREECRQHGIVTEDPVLLRLFRDVKKGAASSLTVLLLGEPGTGKELFARAIHRLSPRARNSFIAVNMAAVSPELFESELFGHVKGSFTGASADRRGFFELANHGTIFLDEIGDLRLDHQSKLLRVLQEKSFFRVGATAPITVDVRVVAATNRDLQRGVSEGWFREDLYFRLKGLVVHLPSLRERPGDTRAIAEAALADIAGQMRRPIPKLSNDALRLLTEHDWPGNVRELRQAIERAMALTDGPILTKGSFSLDSPEGPPRGTPASPDSAGDAAVLASLRRHGFDMQATARTLSWDRSTVMQRLKGLCFQALVEAEGDQGRAALSIAGDSSHVRTVELKVMEYYGHLLAVIEPFDNADQALGHCRRRFKNLPDRHFPWVEALVRRHFARTQGPAE
ncbi:MAG TPA: sigma 54-interacting transcriptional regulator [Nitrospira sp.]|nr:sigma 54-interacting transcriptional regulator [Nitrospira sp.]